MSSSRTRILSLCILAFKWAIVAAISNHIDDWNVIFGLLALRWDLGMFFLFFASPRCSEIENLNVAGAWSGLSTVKGERRDLASGANTNTLRGFYT